MAPGEYKSARFIAPTLRRPPHRAFTPVMCKHAHCGNSHGTGCAALTWSQAGPQEHTLESSTDGQCRVISSKQSRFKHGQYTRSRDYRQTTGPAQVLSLLRILKGADCACRALVPYKLPSFLFPCEQKNNPKNNTAPVASHDCIAK